MEILVDPLLWSRLIDRYSWCQWMNTNNLQLKLLTCKGHQKTLKHFAHACNTPTLPKQVLAFCTLSTMCGLFLPHCKAEADIPALSVASWPWFTRLSWPTHPAIISILYWFLCCAPCAAELMAPSVLNNCCCPPALSVPTFCLPLTCKQACVHYVFYILLSCSCNSFQKPWYTVFFVTPQLSLSNDLFPCFWWLPQPSAPSPLI